MKVNVINKSKNSLPQYATPGASGMDVRANLETTITIQPFERCLIPTGLYFEIPIGYEIQVRPRSGLALKNGITVLNTPGTVDSDYRGELGIILINHSSKKFEVKQGDRIAQIIFNKYENVELFQVKNINETERMDHGFGSTGIT